MINLDPHSCFQDNPEHRLRLQSAEQTILQLENDIKAVLKATHAGIQAAQGIY